MTTAVDTSVLIAIAMGETSAAAWIDLLIEARSEGELVICDVVAAEFFAVLMDKNKFRRSLRNPNPLRRNRPPSAAQKPASE